MAENTKPGCTAEDDSCSCRLFAGHELEDHPSLRWHRCTCGHAWMDWPLDAVPC